jgi:hydrophobe/amphiphile efflux-1 (HAE1) family protein
MFSRFFIERPIFAGVLSIIIVLAGLAALASLPVAQFPEITPPTVVITANYPGASAEVLQQTVAAPIEQQVNGVENMIYMSSSSSSSGTVSITVSFEIGTDADQATISVNNRVQQATPRLPQDVRTLGVTVQKRSATFLEILTLQSPDGRYDPIFLSNYASLNIIDELKRLAGVGDATVFGARDYSMRIWIKPDRMQQLGLTTTDVVQALQQQNSQFAAGKVGQAPTDRPVQLTYTVTTKGRLVETSEFDNIILRAHPDGSVLRLKDIARIELGAQSYDVVSQLNGKAAIAIGINLQTGANALSVANAVGETMQRLSQRFPPGVQYTIPYDTTRFVVVSIKEVVKTLIEAMLLVFAVVYLFLQNWRATLIPCLAVPVSLIGAFAGMYLLGFSINTLTLLSMVLAIGIVVDDAIVVLENVERIMAQEGLEPRQAAIKAMQEVSGPVIAIVLVICSVFVPVGFLGGMTGELYKQFAITIAVSVAISGFVALTLSPALCAVLLKPSHEPPPRLFQRFNAWFDRVTERYTRGVAFIIKRTALALSLVALMLLATLGLFRLVPTSFIPAEDQGFFIAAAILPEAASIDRTMAVTERVNAMIVSDPAVANLVTINGLNLLAGGNKTSAATMFATLQPWDERSRAQHVERQIMKLMMQGSSLKEALVLAFNPPPISGLGITGGFEFYLQNRGVGDAKELEASARQFIAAAAKRPELTGLSTTFSASVPQLYVDVDRDKAEAYGVSVSDIFATMQSTFGTLYVNDFNKFGRTYRVQLQAEASYRTRPQDIGHVYVRSNKTGGMVPLQTLLNVQYVTGAEQVDRFNVFPAVKIMGNAAPGYSSGQAIQAMEAVANDALSGDYSYAWSGTSYQERRSGGTSMVAFAFGLIMVFLILSAQYERWSLPISVLLAVPFGLFGALVTVWLRGLTNDIYFQISLLVLIGLSAKNAILIVEFAVLQREQGMSAVDAAVAAARLRFRPILMTSIAFILGSLPLAIATGAGAASRHSIGTGVVGGMLSATFLAVLFVPLFYTLLSRRDERGVPLAKSAPPNPSRSPGEG